MLRKAKLSISIFGVLAILAATTLINHPGAQAFGGGTGTRVDPYLISTCQELQDINNDVAKSYALATDIDCSMTTSWNAGMGFVPLGGDLNGKRLMDVGFTGSFDGRGHAISNLFMDRQSLFRGPAGLFSRTSGASIYNVHVVNQTIMSDDHTGGLVGQASVTRIAGVSVESTFDCAGHSTCGGLVGRSGDYGLIRDSSATVNMSIRSGSDGSAGGLVGEINSDTQITNSYAVGNIIDSSGSDIRVGGLVGYYSTNVAGLTQSFASVNLSSTSQYVGGLMGNSNVDNGPTNYFDATVAGVTNCSYDYPTECTVVNADGLSPNYFNNNSSNAPLDQWDFSTIWQTTAGLPTLRATTIPFGTLQEKPSNVGADVVDATTLRVHWTQPPLGLIYGVQIKKPSDTAWTVGDMTNEHASSYVLRYLTPSTTYQIRLVGLSAEYGSSEPTSVVTVTTPAVTVLPGAGSPTDPYRISNCLQLQSVNEILAVSQSAKHASYILTQDIDCTATGSYNAGAGFAPIGSSGESLASGARFDGQGHVINGLTIDTTNPDDLSYYPYEAGLFGNVNGLVVRNLTLSNVAITCGSQTYYCGGLVGSAQNSSISGIEINGLINNQSTGVVGLLAAYYQNGVVQKSSTSGSLQAGESGAVGGLIGRISESQIDNTYSNANITAVASLDYSNLEAGGLIGSLTNTILRTSYSSGSISVTNPILGFAAVGGLVGVHNYNAGIISSFSRSPISYSGVYGGLVGSFVAGSLAGNNYDRAVTTATGCDQTGANSCDGVNIGGTSPDYYNNNSTNSPLDAWDYTSVWQLTSGLPILKSAPIASPNPPTNLMATSSGNSVSLTWDPPLNTGSSPISQYILEYKKVGTSTWYAVEAPNADYTFNNLSVATQYAFRVYAVNEDDNYSQPSATIFATTNLDGYIAVSSCQDLQNIQDDLTANYYLAHNIDCSDTVNWNGGGGFIPIGVIVNTGFEGTLLGNGYTINDLYMHLEAFGEQGFGLFSYANGANIQDIRFVRPTIIARSVTGTPGIGVVAGLANQGSITNVQVTDGLIEAVDQTSSYIGGLVGLGSAPIAQSSFTGTIAHGGSIGGLLGAASSQVTNGLPLIRDSYAQVDITIMPSLSQNTPAFAGGLVGTFTETIDNSYATGSITVLPGQGQAVQGGLVGFVQQQNNSQQVTIHNSFSKMTLDQSSPIRGGIAGATFAPQLDFTTSYFDATAADTQLHSYLDVDATTTAHAVNTSGSDPGYFYANKTNPPMDSWDFTDIWQLTELTPTFQTESVLSPVSPGASIRPVAPTAPEGSGGTVTSPVATSTTEVAQAGEAAERVAGRSIQTKPADEVGVIGAIKHFVRSLPKSIVVGFPYALFALLGLAALILLIFLVRELRRLHIIEALIHKQQLLAEERDAFWHLAANYLRAPVTLIVGGAEALRESHQTDGTKAIATLAASLQTKVGEIMNKIEGSTSLQAIKSTHEHVVTKVARKAIFIVPLAIVAGLTLFGNYAAVSYRNLNPGLTGYATQFTIFVIVSVLFYWVLSLLTRGTSKRKQAEARLAAQTADLANARHELIEDTASSLNPDLTRLEGMLKGLPAPMATTAVGALATLHEGSDRLRGIVTSFALLIKVQEGTGSVKSGSGSVDLSGILNKVRSKLTPEITSKGVHVSAPAVPLAVTAESDMAQQVIESIVANAVDYSPANGTVKVEARQLEDAIQLRVTDQGKGIDKKQLDHLFQPFVRADGTSAMDMSHGGFGINLYLDKLIMEQMGGSITAVSTPGKGTAITMTWPTASN